MSSTLAKSFGIPVYHKHQLTNVCNLIRKGQTNKQTCLVVSSVRKPFQQQISSYLQHFYTSTKGRQRMPLIDLESSCKELNGRLAQCDCTRNLRHPTVHPTTHPTKESMCSAATKNTDPEWLFYHCNMKFWSESFAKATGLYITSSMGEQLAMDHFLYAPAKLPAQPCDVFIVRLEDFKELPRHMCSNFPQLPCSLQLQVDIPESTHVLPLNSSQISINCAWTKAAVDAVLGSESWQLYTAKEQAIMLSAIKRFWR